MINFNNVTFIYEDHDKKGNGIRNINLTINQGECIVLCGVSGCGKTTMTRLINGLIPHFYSGELIGTIEIDSINVSKQSITKTSEIVGSVFQNPRTQFFNVDTTSELAFGCENLGMAVEEIISRIDETKNQFSLGELMDRSIFNLSGGEKQRIACGSVYATHPEIFVLDEPSSSLDAPSIFQLKKVIKKLKDMQKTIVISEHRLHYLRDIADRYIYMKEGRVEQIYDNMELKSLKDEELEKLGLRSLDLRNLKSRENLKPQHGCSIEIRDLIYRRDSKKVLNIKELDLHKGEIIALIGHNGAGKTTLANCLCGLLKHSGKITQCGKKLNNRHRVEKSYMVMQDVNCQLFTESVVEEVSLNQDTITDESINKVLESLGLLSHKECHPMTLSGGQKQRVALASAIIAGKEILIYDEPTSGLDYENMLKMCRLVSEKKSDCYCTLIITHDPELILGACNRVIHLDRGKIIDDYELNTLGIEKVKEYFINNIEGYLKRDK